MVNKHWLKSHHKMHPIESMMKYNNDGSLKESYLGRLRFIDKVHKIKAAHRQSFFVDEPSTFVYPDTF